MSNKTNTPLTDEHCGIREDDDPEDFFCTLKFTRDLERQLAEAKKDADDIDWALANAKHWMSECENLEAQLAEAKRDTERLEWLLDGNMWRAVHSAPYGHAYIIQSRDSIDRAMKEEK